MVGLGRKKRKVGTDERKGGIEPIKYNELIKGVFEFNGIISSTITSPSGW